ncbi:TonB-dependent receptor domain-containing protein [Collimonas sp.]|jgi:outer membrane receptor for ferrienterochelin and colicins|uniref:TonB-dependent receptor domain-containing protein n=1 Tax=Collimonas sp. TaxID=1963772 RepID=UPI002CECCCC8|nr:TonB-dependent receptor [Collimonas sp.]HWW04189.1 TonB-dependent receptor [Collimonas sp.]
MTLKLLGFTAHCVRALPALCGGVFVGTVSAGSAYAETTLKEVVVTASGYEQQIKDAPATISVITREQLEKQPFNNLQDAVSHLEGVSIVGGDNNSKDISIRGMPGEYTLILVDGKRQGTRETSSRGTGGIQSSLIPPLAAIERIEVVRGPMSSLYGSDAIGGVINIITRKVPKTWGGALNVSTTTQQRSNLGNEYQGDFYLAGPIKDDVVGLQIYGNLNTREEDKVVDGISQTDTRSITAKLGIKPASNQDITLEAGHEELKRTYTPGKSLAPDDSQTISEDTRTHWAASHTGRWNFGTTDLALYQEIGEFNGKTDGPLGPEAAAASPKITNTILDAQVTLPFTSNILKMGGQYTHNQLDGTAAESPTRIGRTTLNYTNPGSITRKSWALFAEDEYFVTSKLSLTGGLRLDHDDKYGQHFNPRVYAVYQLAPTLTLRGGVAKAFRAPNLRQSSAGYVMSSGGPTSMPGVLYGNPDLKAETSINQEIGLRYDGPDGLSGSVTVFNNDFKDKIVSDFAGRNDALTGLPLYTYNNIAKVNIRGVELGATVPLSNLFKLSGNYTYTDSKRESDGETAFNGSSLKGQPLDKTPKHAANLKLDWLPRDGVSAFARANYVSEQFWAAYRNGGAGVRSRPATTTFDLGGSYAINKMLTLNAALLNLTDKVVDVDRRPRATINGNWLVDEGRRLWLGLNARF